jgi:hypothetical protein
MAEPAYVPACGSRARSLEGGIEIETKLELT